MEANLCTPPPDFGYVADTVADQAIGGEAAFARDVLGADAAAATERSAQRCRLAVFGDAGRCADRFITDYYRCSRVALVPSGLPELTFLFATPTAPVLDAAISAVTRHDLRRTAVVPFTAGIANGEGKSYDERGFPTLAAIAGPWTLRSPSFGMETVDVEAMRRMTLAFRDVVVQLQEIPRANISDGRPCRSM